MLDLLISILAVFRISEILVRENGPFDIFLRWRLFLGKNAYRGSAYKTVADLFNCVYCMSVWASFIVLVIPKGLRYALAISGGHSIIQTWLHHD